MCGSSKTLLKANGALKNAIDCVSRAETDDEPPPVAFTGKTSVLCAASPGALGGLRGLVTVRSILGNIGVTVLPDRVAVSKAHEAFRTNGSGSQRAWPKASVRG